MPYIFYHHLLSHRMHYTEMNELYISLSMRALAIGVAGLFVPIYLYELGYSLTMIALFYLISSVLRFVTEFVSAAMISRFGPKHVMIASFVFLMAFFLSLYAIPLSGAFFYVAAVISSFEMGFFWISSHTQMKFNRSGKSASTQVGMTFVLRKMFGAVGPLFGGVIAALFGVEYILLVAAVVLGCAMYPLLKTEDMRGNIAFKLRNFKFIPPWRSDAISQLANQFDLTLTMQLWPLYMFLILGAFDEIGLILSASIVVGVLLTFYVGKLGDKGFNESMLKVGVALKSIVHLLRVLSQGFFGFLFVNLFSDMSQTLIAGPHTESYYERADDDNDSFNYIVAFSIISAFVKTLFWSLILVFTLLFTTMTVFTLGFLLAAAVVLFIPLITKRVYSLK